MRYLRLRVRRPSKPTIFALLMGVSLLMALLPNDPLGPIKNVTQLVAPLQMVTLEATRGLSAPVSKLTAEPIDAARHSKLLEANRALQNENAVLRQELSRRQATIDELSGIRGRDGFPREAVLIPARVVSLEASPGRDSMLVGKGQIQNVKPGDWVITRMEVDAGTADGVRDTAAVLARQYLIGWVQQAGPFTSRVVLLSDGLARRPMRVHIAPLMAGNDEYRVLTAKGKPLTFVLEGAGRGTMRLRDIPASLVDAGHVRVGDLITCDPNNASLPVPLVVGEITRLDLNRDKPVHYDALVRCPQDPNALNQVYVADLGRGSADTTGRKP